MKLQGDVYLRKLVVSFLMLLGLCIGVRAAPAGYVALTFDDGPSGDNTVNLMEMLEERDVCATFFLCGYRMEAFPEMPEKLQNAGHELGLHGYTHTCFDTLTPEELRQELTDAKEKLTELTGQAPTLLRPPCGAWNTDVKRACQEAGISVILWSVDPEDWRCHDSRKIADTVCSEVQNGSIILMHDLYPSSVEAAAQIIDTLKQQGYEFVTVSELAALGDCELRPGDVFSQFSGAHPPEKCE